MLSKKLNDPFYWKNKLETLNCLPGEDIQEKDVMWEKLNSRLQQKPVAGKARWYWMAAGLVPLIIVALMMVSDSEIMLMKPETIKVKTIKLTPAYLLPASTETVSLSVAAPAEKKQSAFVAVNPKMKSKNFNDTIKSTDIVVSLLPEQKAIKAAIANMPSPDSSVTVSGTATIKQKLHVVHINDLETFPVHFGDPVNYSNKIRSTKNKINNQTVITLQNSIGFKIKLSSKN